MRSSEKERSFFMVILRFLMIILIILIYYLDAGGCGTGLFPQGWTVWLQLHSLISIVRHPARNRMLKANMVRMMVFNMAYSFFGLFWILTRLDIHGRFDFAVARTVFDRLAPNKKQCYGDADCHHDETHTRAPFIFLIVEFLKKL